jgi:chromosome segregation ATPase
VLDEDKARNFQDLLSRLDGSVSPTDAVREQLNQSFELLSQQQERLNYHWQSLEQQRSQTQQRQSEVDQRGQEIQNRWNEWHQAQATLEQARAELKAQQSALTAKEEYAGILGVQLQHNEDLYQQMYRLAENSDNIQIGRQVDIVALEKLSIDELQKLVRDLESELEKSSRFVESQEEELTLKQQEIEELKAKIQAANDYDRLNLENELADEQDGYQMLNETLVGQRRSLQERKTILSQHQSLLRRRQGLPEPEGRGPVVDLGPVIAQVETLRHQQVEELHKLEAQIQQIKAAIQQAEGLVNNQSAEQENKRNALKQQESELVGERSQLAELQGKIALYQEWLQPVQDAADGLRQKLEAIAGDLSQVQETGNSQSQALAEIRQLLASLTNTPEFV